jgi:hypothetical protein
MNKSKSPPLARRLLAVLALLAFGAVSLHAEDAFVTSYTGASSTGNPPFNYGTGISTYGTSTIGTASPTPPARTRAMYGYQNGTNAWVSTQPTVLTSGAGSWYKMYVLRGTDGNAPSDVIVNITTPDGILLDPSGTIQTAIPSTAFRAASGAVNNWLFVGTISNLTTKTPTITWAYASGTQGATGGRCYFDAFRFFFNDPCAAYTQVGISGAVYAGQTVVHVSGVVAGATDVTVFANGTQIGTTNHPAGFAAGTVAVPTSALVKGTVIKAQQSAGTCVSGMPGAGPVVGGGANPNISVSLGCWKNSAWTGPVGVNAPGSFGSLSTYFVKATGQVNGYGTAPVGGQELIAGPCWQEVTFNQQVDPCLDQSTSTALVNSDAYCALESLAFSMDAADSGPYDIYVDSIMNGTNVIEDFEGRATDAGVTFSSPNAASVPSASAYYNTTATNSSLVSTNYAFDGTNACRVQWQFSDNSNIRWAHVLASRATGKTYPMLDVHQPVTVKFLVLPAGVTTAHKFNGTVGAITNASVSYAAGTNTFGVTVTGSGPYTYQWYADSYGGFINGATDRTFKDDYLPATAGTTNNYTVTISDGTCSETRTLAVIVAAPLPVITNQPVSSVVNVGSAAPAPLSVLAGAYPTGLPLSYQWEFLGNSPTNAPTAVGPATTAALGDGIPTAQLINSGYYDVIVANSFGSVTSSIVSMQVVDAGVLLGSGSGLRGDYFNLPTWSGAFVTRAWAGTPPVTRVDPTINFDWLLGSPVPGTINVDCFGVRWYGQIQPLTSEAYTFTMRSDDGVRLWIDKQLVIDWWQPQGATDRTGTITLDTSKHDLLMEYFDQGSYASAKLFWTNASGTIAKTLVPIQQLYANKLTWTPPSVALTGPANGSSVTPPASFSLSANVTTNDGMVASVAFYTNAILLATVTAPPYNFTWSPTAPGTYPISARVLYNASANGASPSSFAVSGTNTVTVLTNPKASVTISNIVDHLNGTYTVNYGGGGGTEFVVVGSTDIKLTRDAWTPVATNSSTPGSITFTGLPHVPVLPVFYAIESK